MNIPMRNGLEFVKFKSFLNLIEELDASNVVLMLDAHQQSLTYVGSLLMIVLVLIIFRSLKFLHVRCKANQTAYYLSKYSLHNLDCI